MEAHGFFLSLILILVGARVLGELATRLGVPAVIGELGAGVLLGPSVLGWLEVNETLHLMAEFGVLLLLFQVGLESDMGRLVRSGPRATVVALGGFILPFALGFGLCNQVFDLALLPSILIGGTLTATSIGVTLRVLEDIHRRGSPEGQIVLGAAVLDDLLGVILLAILFDFAQAGEIHVGDTLKIVLFLALFFAVAPVLARVVSRVVSHASDRSDIPGMIPTAMISVVLLFAWLAHQIGAPELLGGFAAGLALSRRFFLPFGLAVAKDHDFSERVVAETRPIVQLVTPIFFVVVGATLDLRVVDWGSGSFWLLSLSLTALAVIGKFGGAVLISEHPLRRFAIGMAMVPRGEVGLVFAEMGRTTGIVDNDTYAVLIIVIAYTTLFAPFWIKWFYQHYGDRLAEIDQHQMANDH